MSENYSQMEMALMDLDRAVSQLAKQADGVRNKLSARKPQVSGDLFSLLGVPQAASAHPSGSLDIGTIERKLDATIAQIEDLLNDDAMVSA